MTLDIALELARVLALCLILGILLAPRQSQEPALERGRRVVAGGFALLLFGSLIDAAAGVERLATLFGGPWVAALLENGSYLIGFVLLAAGLRLWLTKRGTAGKPAAHRGDLPASLSAGPEESEELFRGVVENSPSAIFVKDPEGRFRIVSKRFEEWYGVPADGAIGKTSYEIFPRTFADAYVAQDGEVLRLRRTVEREQEIVFQDGSTHSIMVTKFPVLDAGGEPIGVGTINTDLTAHKRALAALRDSEAALAEAQRLAKVGNWRWSIERDQLVSCSDEFARIHGVEPEAIHDLMKDEMARVIHPEDRERVSAAFKRFDQESLDYDIEYRIVLPDGEVRHIYEIGEAVCDCTGRLIEQVGTVQDITERKMAEEALLAAKEAAELADRAKTEFLANMSHELRTPLNMVIGFAELIESERLGPIGRPKYREYAGDILRAGQHLLDVISDILDLSRIESGNLQPREDDVDIADLMKACVNLMAERAQSAGVALSLDFEPGDEACLRADPRMMKQILINLISNGIKFTPRGGSVKVTGQLSRKSGYLLQIIDTGIGIAPADIPKALARFQQVDGQLNRTYEGSGLGLPLSKSLVEAHDGSLELESIVGEGTTVTARLPAERVVPLPAAFPLVEKKAIAAD